MCEHVCAYKSDWCMYACIYVSMELNTGSMCSGACDKEIILKSLQVSLFLFLRCFITTNTVLQEPSGDSTIQSYGPYTHI